MFSITSPVTKPRSVDNTSNNERPAHWFELDYNSRTLMYTVEIIGDQTQPASGYTLYIGMHGGGTDTDGRGNDRSWTDSAARFYHEPVKAFHADASHPKRGPALLVCPRGISSGEGTSNSPRDSWDLHAQPEACLLFSRMIANLIQQNPPELEVWEALRKDSRLNHGRRSFVDPNRVILWGFSAGGDGAFRIGTRMPDLFAAVVPAAGHPGDAHFASAANVRLLMEVGEDDYHDGQYPFQRAQVYMNTAAKIEKARLDVPKEFRVSTYPYTNYVVEYEGAGNASPHNYWSQPDKIDQMQHVLDSKMDNVTNWFKNFLSPGAKTVSDRSNLKYKSVDIDPIHILEHELRRTSPEYVVWDLSWQSQEPQDTYPRFFYWLCQRKKAPADGSGDIQRASYSMQSGALRIYTPCEHVAYLFRDQSTNRPLAIYIGDSATAVWSGKLAAQDNIRADTYKARADRNLQYSAMVYLEKQADGTWVVKEATKLDDGLQV